MTFLTGDEEELAIKYISIAGLIRDNNGYVAVEKQQIQDGTETLHQAITEEDPTKNKIHFSTEKCRFFAYF